MMLEFVQLLRQRYQDVITNQDGRDNRQSDYPSRVEQLLYAEALVRKTRLVAEQPQLPLQIAVIGPTQVGKSSVVNALLGQSMAVASPLAGYTVNPQGFCHRLNVDDCSGLQHYFGRFQRVDDLASNPPRYDCFLLKTVPEYSTNLPECVIWDTPDFDSIDAIDYREGLVRTIALADLVIVVVSKEKYADQSVWDVLELIEGFGQPTLICLNKLAAGSEPVIIESFERRWRQTRTDAVPTIVAIGFDSQTATTAWPSAASGIVARLATTVTRKQQPHVLRHWLSRRWQHWLEPVYAEQAALRHWQSLVEQALTQASELYRRDYLDHPQHYQTFQAALLKLLNLLELPGIANVMSKTRRVMTWPMRKIMTLGRQPISTTSNHELDVLKRIAEHVLIQLADYLLEKAEASRNPWWRDSARLLREQRPQLIEHFNRAAIGYHRDFQQDVDAASQRLYRKLETHPLLLNSLRATRISTDAGAMVLAIQAGGIGVHDLLITPILLSVTSSLTESAIGGYMHTVEADLKRQQLHAVENRLFHGVLQQSLYPLPTLSRSKARFHIDERQCQDAENALKENAHGLRLL